MLQQVEDTLNNSNDLFLSFRKEMEDMSKKGKRLEKENEGLKRQKDATTANIIRMAEERQDWKKKTESAEKKSEKLMSIIQAMQQQGRSVPPSMATTLESCFSDGHAGDEESDYSEDGEEGGMSEFDDDTEEEPQPADKVPGDKTTPVTYGPERPPQQQQQSQATINGH
jgi:chromosome segregation ATPase